MYFVFIFFLYFCNSLCDKENMSVALHSISRHTPKERMGVWVTIDHY